MRSRLMLSILLLALVAALIAVFWQQRGEVPAAGGEASTADAPAAAATQAMLPAAVQATVGERSAAPASGRTELATGKHYSLRGRVIADRRVPLTGAQVRAFRGEPTDRAGLFQEAMLLATAPGGPGRARPAFVIDDDAIALATVPVGEDGSFAIERLQERHLRLDLDHPFHGLDAPFPVHLSEDQPAVVTLEAYLGAQVIGTAEGASAEGARAQIASEVDPMSVMRDPRSFFATILQGKQEPKIGADGRFEFRAVPPSPEVRVFVRGERAVGASAPFGLTAGETREVVVPVATARRLTISVLDDAQRPIAGAEVTATATELAGEYTLAIGRRRGTTGSEGTCVIDGIGPGVHDLTVEAEGYVTADRKLGEQETGPITVTLQEGASVEGLVVDAAGKPLVDAGIAIVPAMKLGALGDMSSILGDDFLAQTALRSRCRSDAEGRFHLGGVPEQDEFGVAAAHADHVAAMQRDVRAGRRDLRIQLLPASRIRGRVVDEDNKPVPEFTVQTTVTFAMWMQRPTAREVVSGSADGSFTLGRLAPGKVTLKIEGEGYGRHEQSLAIEAGQELDAGTIRLQRAAVLLGRVVDMQQKPVPFAQVRRMQGGIADHPVLSMLSGDPPCRAGADGRFELRGLKPGRVTLLASADGYASGRSKRVELAAGQTIEGIEIVLGSGGTIEGKLLLPPGRSPTTFSILVQTTSGMSQAGANPNPDGTFRIEHLDPGQYQVQGFDSGTFQAFGKKASKSAKRGQTFEMDFDLQDLLAGMVQTRCSVRDGEVTHVELDGRELEGSGITLHSEVTLGSQPLAQGMLELMPASDPNPRVAVGFVTAGKSQISGLTPGRWRAQVRTGMTWAPVGEPQFFELVADRQSQTATFRLPAGALRGSVIDVATGKPVEHAVIKLRAAGATGADESTDYGFAMTGSKGEFAFEGLNEGTYSITADEVILKQGGTAGRLENLRLGAAEQREGLVLHARRGTVVDVEVVDENGTPLPQAMLFAVDDDGRPIGALSFTFTDSFGHALFPGLPSGRTRIAGRAPGLAPAVTDSQDVVPGQETEFRLVLRRGTPVQLTIEGQDGKALQGAQVSCRLGRGPWIPTPLLQAVQVVPGTLDVGPLPPGEIQFRVVHPSRTFEVMRSVPSAQRASLVLR